MHKSLMVLAAVAVASGCQGGGVDSLIRGTLEPSARYTRTIIGAQPKPNLLLLVETSGSMNLALVPSALPCPAGCGAGSAPACPMGCLPTRLSEVAWGLGVFHDQRAATLRTGLAAFPPAASADACAGSLQLDFPAPLSLAERDDDTAQLLEGAAVKTGLAKLTASGSSPIAAALRSLSSHLALLNPYRSSPREDFVLLVTDGVADCGASMPSLVSVVTELRKKGIRTLVFGFGSDAASPGARAALDPIAEAGGFVSMCPSGSDAECGPGGSCLAATRFCDRKYLYATTGSELASQLLTLTRPPVDRGFGVCVVPVEPQPTPITRLRVFFDGAEVLADDPGGGWTFANRQVTFNGAQCRRLEQALPASPVKLEIHVFTAP